MKRVIKVNYADEIKSRVTARELFQFYGFEIKRGGFCKSPFSPNDKTPSLKVYDGGRGWHDFSSGNGGSVIDFVMQYFNLTFTAAIDKINADFNLGLSIGEKQTAEERRIAHNMSVLLRAERERKRRQQEQLENEYHAALDAFIALDLARITHAPSTVDCISAEYADAVKALPIAKYRLEVAEMALDKFKQEQDA